jgi:hypothetical protein
VRNARNLVASKAAEVVSVLTAMWEAVNVNYSELCWCIVGGFLQ